MALINGIDIKSVGIKQFRTPIRLGKFENNNIDWVTNLYLKLVTPFTTPSSDSICLAVINYKILNNIRDNQYVDYILIYKDYNHDLNDEFLNAQLWFIIDDVTPVQFENVLHSLPTVNYEPMIQFIANNPKYAFIFTNFETKGLNYGRQKYRYAKKKA